MTLTEITDPESVVNKSKTWLSTADLANILDEIWQTMVVAGSQAPAPAMSSGAPLHAYVSVTGEWDGDIVIACSMRIAQWVATQLLQIPIEEITSDDVSDALGELANVVGGAVKSLMPQPSTLSLPTLTDDDPHRAHLTSAVNVSIQAHSELISLTVWTPAAPGLHKEAQ